MREVDPGIHAIIYTDKVSEALMDYKILCVFKTLYWGKYKTKSRKIVPGTL